MQCLSGCRKRCEVGILAGADDVGALQACLDSAFGQQRLGNRHLGIAEGHTLHLCGNNIAGSSFGCDVVGQPQVVVTILGDGQRLGQGDDVLAIGHCRGCAQTVVDAKHGIVSGAVDLDGCDVGRAGCAGGIPLHAAHHNGVLVAGDGELDLLHDVVGGVSQHSIAGGLNLDALDHKRCLLVQAHLDFPSVERRSRCVGLKDHCQRAVLGLADQVLRTIGGAVARHGAQEVVLIGFTATVDIHFATANREGRLRVELHSTVVTAGHEDGLALEALGQLAVFAAIVIEHERLGDGDNIVTADHVIDIFDHTVAVGVALGNSRLAISADQCRHLGVNHGLGSGIGLDIDGHPQIVAGFGQVVLTGHGHFAGSGVLDSAKCHSRLTIILIVIIYAHPAHNLLRVLQVELHASQRLDRQCAFGHNLHIEQSGIGGTHGQYIAAGLVDGDLVDGHVVVEERAHGSHPAGAGVVAAGGLGVETNGERAIGTGRANLLARTDVCLAGIAQAPQQVLATDSGAAVDLKHGLGAVARAGVIDIKLREVYLGNCVLNGRGKGHDIVGIGGLILAAVALGVGELPLATDVVAVAALGGMADVVDHAGRTHCLGRGVCCAAHCHVLQREGHLLAILCLVVEVEHDGEVIVSLGKLLVARQCNGGARHLYLAEWVGSGKGVLLAQRVGTCFGHILGIGQIEVDAGQVQGIAGVVGQHVDH